MQQASKSTEAARASHAVANNVGASGKSHPAVRPVPVQRVVGSPSEAYEDARKEEIDSVWVHVPEKIQAIKQQAIQQEKSAKDTTVLYHAAGLGSYALHQVIKVIYEAVNNVPTGDHVFFRAPGNKARTETTEGPQRFLETRKGPSWSDHDETNSLMSANIALQANVNSNGESTFDILQSGGLFDINKKKMLEIISEMLKSMNIFGDIQTEILAEVEALGTAIEDISNSPGSKKSSVLYQILIPNDLVSKLVYIAQTNGHPFDYELFFTSPGKTLGGIAAAGKELKDGSMESFGTESAATYRNMDADDDDQEKKAKDTQWKVALFRSTQFTTMVLNAAKTTSFWLALKDELQDPQARILMEPQHFAPGGSVKTNTYPILTDNASTVLQQGLGRIGTAASKGKSQEDKWGAFQSATPSQSGTAVEWGEFEGGSWADFDNAKFD
jgi:hypothetical protein